MEQSSPLEIFRNSIRAAFELVEMDKTASPATRQTRYSLASIAVMQLLRDIGEEELGNRFNKLSIELCGLDKTKQYSPLEIFSMSIRGAFEIVEMDKTTDPVAAQTSYSFACVAVMQLLHAIGEEESGNRFLALAVAFNELSEGTVVPMFRPPVTPDKPGKPGQKNDRPALWKVRAQVCVGIRLMEHAGIEPDQALEYVLKHEESFQKVLRTGSGLKTAVKNWLKLFQTCEVSDVNSTAIYEEAMKDMPEIRRKLSGEQMIASGKEMIDGAAIEASWVI